MRGHRRETPARLYTADEWAERERIGARCRGVVALGGFCGAFGVFAAGESAGWGLPAGLAVLAGSAWLGFRGRAY